MVNKRERVAGLIRECAGEYISRESNRQTMVTPTRVFISPDSKQATIFVSVFPAGDSKEALQFLMRHRSGFRDFLKKNVRLRVTPFVEFALDQEA
jgi:ribosome-binding factor A